MKFLGRQKATFDTEQPWSASLGKTRPVSTAPEVVGPVVSILVSRKSKAANCATSLGLLGSGTLVSLGVAAGGETSRGPTLGRLFATPLVVLKKVAVSQLGASARVKDISTSRGPLLVYGNCSNMRLAGLASRSRYGKGRLFLRTTAGTTTATKEAT